MQKFFLSCIAFFASTTLVFAGGGYGYGNSQVYLSDDGSHSTEIIMGANSQEIKIDGTSKWTYDYIEAVAYVGTDSYILARKMDTKRSVSVGYMLKNGSILASGDFLSGLLTYDPIRGNAILKGYSNYDSTRHIYKVRNLTGEVIFESSEAGQNNYSRYEGTLLIHQVSSRDNIESTTYIGKTRIGKNMNLSGIIMNGKKPWYAIFTSYSYGMNAMGTSETHVSAYDMTAKKMKKLPLVAPSGYPAETRNPQTSQLMNITYPIVSGSGYQMYTFDGSESYDPYIYETIPMITQYGQGAFVSFKKDDRQYFRWEGKTYGPYDLVDTFNTSYGYPPVDSSWKVVRWSVFVRKDGVDMVVINGKEVPLP